jgi:hypothetical protein
MTRRLGAAAGLAYFILVMVGNTIATAGSHTGENSSGEEILRDLQAHHGAAFVIGGTLELLGFAALLAFVAYLASVLRRAEGEDGWLWLAALGAGMVTIAIKLGSAAPVLVAVWRVDELDPTTARTLTDINSFAFLISWSTTALFIGSAALVALRTRVLPRWIAVSGLVIAVTGLAGVPAGPEGPGAFPFMLGLLWIAAVSVVLMRRASAPAAVTAAPRTAAVAA